MCLSFHFFACFSRFLSIEKNSVQVKDYPCRLKKYITVKSVVLKKKLYLISHRPFNLLFSLNDVCGSPFHDNIEGLPPFKNQ